MQWKLQNDNNIYNVLTKGLIDMNPTSLSYFWHAMLNLPLAITMINIMSKMAILAMLVIALGVINLAIKGIQVKSMKKPAQ